jgi:hypothetical protein
MPQAKPASKSVDAIEIGSFKLRFRDGHVRIMPAIAFGLPFLGPGVDLLGDEAARVLALGKPLKDWLLARDPSVRVRAISCDYESRVVIISYEADAGVAAQKPIALKLRAPESEELLTMTDALRTELQERAKEKLSRR